MGNFVTDNASEEVTRNGYDADGRDSEVSQEPDVSPIDYQLIDFTVTS